MCMNALQLAMRPPLVPALTKKARVPSGGHGPFPVKVTSGAEVW